MKSHLIIAATVTGLAFALGETQLRAADDTEKFVTRDEFQKLRQENDLLKKELESWREFKSQFEQWKQQQAGRAAAGAQAAPTETSQGMAAQVAAPGDAKELARSTFPGSTKFLLTGYGAAGFTALRNNDAAFNAQFNPMLLWKITDRLLFEGELEMELEGTETSTALEVANLSYVMNDYVTFQAGKFLNPMNSFVERFHMAWVNRLPDKPLAVYDGLLPETYVGAQLRGGLPLGPTKFNYSGFIANAPQLITSVGPDDDLASLGTMEFNNFDNPGGHVAVGGHVGFQPLPELEVGYGVHWSGLSDSSEHALMQSVDLNYVHDMESLKGMMRLNAQWVWSDLGRGTYDDNGTPVGFRNHRNGGYAQIAYRPTHASWEFLKHVEGVFRYDLFNQAETPVGYDQNRYTVGLNYWLTPKTVFKTAYQFDHKTAGEPDESGVLVQFTSGF